MLCIFSSLRLLICRCLGQQVPRPIDSGVEGRRRPTLDSKNHKVVVPQFGITKLVNITPRTVATRVYER